VHEAVRNVLRGWGWEGMKTGGWVGLSVLGVVAGLVAGVAEALGMFSRFFSPSYTLCFFYVRAC